MALFGKKSKDAPDASGSGATSTSTGSTTTGEKKRGLSLGRKKDTAAPPAPTAPADDTANPEDFFDFSEEALAGGDSAANGAAPDTADNGKGKKKTPKPKGLKSGTVVGLNIGADSIKAIELRVKGTEIAITGMGMLPTPEDSIANGVVMSVASLGHAIRDVLQQAGIKSKRVVTSVAGTGALVVRVIEVPKMSDNELEDNMKVDADRYIPFPPSEVIMDFKALRDLPSDPDAPNMEVLLAAAQREIIDLHVQVLEGAKLDPRSIDVEPLAAVRALTAREVNPDATGADTVDGVDYVDYNDVSAVVNIGASSTEISIVRGDILVFTRNVPTGGQTLTQAIVDYFGLHWPDAEHAKRQWGDALPHAMPQAQTGQTADNSAFFGAAGTAATAPVAADAADDWSEFGLDDTAFDDAPFDVQTIETPAADDAPVATAGAFDADPFGVAQTTSGATAPTTAQSTPVDPFDLDFNPGAQTSGTDAPQAADPFDLDFFDQGPQSNAQNKEPGEQHGQKEDENKDQPEDGDAAKGAPVFDFSGFSFDDEAPQSTPGATEGGDETELPTLQDAATGSSPADEVDDDDAVLPSSAPAAQSQPAPVPSAFDFPAAFAVADEDDESTLPTVVGETGSGAVAGAAPIGTVDLDEDDDAALPTVVGPTSAAGSTPGATSSFSFGNIEPPVTAPGTPSAAGAATVAGATAVPGVPAVEEDDDFDIDSLFGDSPAATPSDAPVQPAAVGGDALAESAGLNEAELMPAPVIAPASTDLGGFDALEGFGAGLTDTGLSGIDEQALYGVISPILDGLIGEVRRSLEYHATRYPDAAVQHITLIGGGAKLKNLDAYFAQSLGIPTTVGNPLAGIKVQAPKLPPDYATETGPMFVVALGLALRDLVR